MSKLSADGLRQLRLRLGLSQQKLANRARLSKAYISNLERGHRRPSLDAILRLARALQADPADLLRIWSNGRRHRAVDPK